MNNYLCRFKLSNFLDSRIIDIENDETGRLEKGIFIPLDRNDLFVTRNNQVIARLLVLKRRFTGDGNTHHIKPAYSKVHRDTIEGLGFSVPFLATMKPTRIFDNYQSNTYNDDNDEEDDL